MVSYQELLEILACPRCKGALTLADKSLVEELRPQWREKMTGGSSAGSARPGQLEAGFVCVTCRLFYAVVDGIPDLVLDDALALPPPAMET
ncbi:MAG: hypothetical protein NZ899_13505 [Thermoguttaceae bacterium]|nr:hypothetical protein [Thermoguttaceae bacterium]MDW8077263.1 Trm112 family protein [Thermoguttaceae bacterium]